MRKFVAKSLAVLLAVMFMPFGLLAAEEVSRPRTPWDFESRNAVPRLDTFVFPARDMQTWEPIGELYMTITDVFERYSLSAESPIVFVTRYSTIEFSADVRIYVRALGSWSLRPGRILEAGVAHSVSSFNAAQIDITTLDGMPILRGYTEPPSITSATARNRLGYLSPTQMPFIQELTMDKDEVEAHRDAVQAVREQEFRVRYEGYREFLTRDVDGLSGNDQTWLDAWPGFSEYDLMLFSALNSRREANGLPPFILSEQYSAEAWLLAKNQRLEDVIPGRTIFRGEVIRYRIHGRSLRFVDAHMELGADSVYEMLHHHYTRMFGWNTEATYIGIATEVWFEYNIIFSILMFNP